MSTKNKIIGFISAVIILAACTAQKDPGFELPEGMLPHVRTEYEKRCIKGKILYNMSCAKCHNTKKRGKEIVPDFKPEQLLGYTLRVSNAQHEQNMPDSLVTEEELGIIMTFLNYKTKNPVKAGS